MLFRNGAGDDGNQILGQGNLLQIDVFHVQLVFQHVNEVTLADVTHLHQGLAQLLARTAAFRQTGLQPLLGQVTAGDKHISNTLISHLLCSLH